MNARQLLVQTENADETLYVLIFLVSLVFVRAVVDSFQSFVGVEQAV